MSNKSPFDNINELKEAFERSGFRVSILHKTKSIANENPDESNEVPLQSTLDDFVPQNSDMAVYPRKKIDNKASRAEKPANFSGALASIPITQSSNKGECPLCRRHVKNRKLIDVMTYQTTTKSRIERPLSLRYCPRCFIPFLTNREYQSLSEKMTHTITNSFNAYDYNNREALMERVALCSDISSTQEDTPKKPNFQNRIAKNIASLNLSFLPNNHRIYVYAQKCHCMNCEKTVGSDMISCPAEVNTVSGSKAIVYVLRCAHCGRFYMNYESYKNYTELYGGLLFECEFDTSISPKAGSWKNFAPDSILSRCGYSVRAGTPEQYRHAVLSYIIDSQRASKHEIIELISSFIRTHVRFTDACQRWRDDIRFVSEYRPRDVFIYNDMHLVKGGTLRK